MPGVEGSVGTMGPRLQADRHLGRRRGAVTLDGSRIASRLEGTPVDVLEVGATWLHTLAFLIVLGYYGILGRFVVPTLERTLDGPMLTRTLVALERRALPWVLLCVGLFIVTGVYLLVVDPHYHGLGNISGSWGALMLLKHLLVAGLVGLGILVDFLVRDLDWAPDTAALRRAVGRIGLVAEGMTGLGAVIILLTVVAQQD
jgi:uncharacterized membrane protein